MGWRLTGGWLGGWRSFRAWMSAFVPVGGGAVIALGTTAVFRSLHCITGLLWQNSSTKQRIRWLLYCCSMVGGLDVFVSSKRGRFQVIVLRLPTTG